MILLTLTNSQTILLVVLGLAIVSLIGWGLLILARTKMERELDLVSVEALLTNEDKPVVKKVVPVEEEFDIEDMLEDVDNEEDSLIKEKPLSEIEVVLAKMQNDLTKEKVSAVSTFEEEQEEKAIISYQELKAAKDKIVPYQDEMEEIHNILKPTTVKEINEDYHRDPVKEEPGKNPQNKSNHFSNSGFISPVYGRLEEKKLDYPSIPNFKNEIDIFDEKENIYEPLTIDYEQEPIPTAKREEIKIGNRESENSQEFLNELKNFRDNLN